MSIFDTIQEEDKKDNVDLSDRYNNLQIYADCLGVDILPLIARAKLEDGLTKENLDDLQMLIESVSEQKELREGAHEIKQINNAEMLDWYFQKLVEYQSEINAIKAQFEAALSKPISKLASFNYMYKKQADAYAEARYKQTGKKTEVFPHGTIKVVTHKESVVIEDEAKLQEWLGNLESFSKAKFEVYPKTYSRNLDALKEAVEKGSNVPGLAKKPAGDTISLKVPV